MTDSAGRHPTEAFGHGDDATAGYAGPPSYGSPDDGGWYGPPSGYGPPPGHGPAPGYAPPPGWPVAPGYGPPPGYGVQPGYGPPPGHGGYPAPYGAPAGWWGGPPRAPQRPGVVVAAAVLCFAQAGLVQVASFYASLLLSAARVFDPGAGDGVVGVTLVQLLSIGLLVAGGVLEFSGRRIWLWAASGAQVALAVYWMTAVGDLSGADDLGGLLVVPLFFLIMPATAVGLSLSGAATAWGELQSRTRAGAGQPIPELPYRTG